MVKRLKAGDHLDAWMQENHRRDDAMWKISFSTVCMVEETNLMIVTIESRRNISRTSSEFDFNKKHPAPSCPTGTGLTFSDSLAHPVATGTWSRILFSTCPISTRVSSTFVLNNRVDYSKQTSRKNSVVKGKISILKQKKSSKVFL
uniref:(northern house mosquito) hypothetical protein n=1 Tax=Culex pipiens TaxID=7175 RepID=A0A8D8KNZ7_CULPI